MKTSALLKAATILITVVNFTDFPKTDLFAQVESSGNLWSVKEKESFFIKKTNSESGSPEIYSAANGLEAISAEEKNKKIDIIGHLKEDPHNLFALAGVIQNGEKNYLHWVVNNDGKNGIFVIEYSLNGYDFYVAGFKNRISSSVPQLSYYYQEKVRADMLYFRILAMGEDGTYKYSDTFKAGKEAENSLSTELFF